MISALVVKTDKVFGCRNMQCGFFGEFLNLFPYLLRECRALSLEYVGQTSDSDLAIQGPKRNAEAWFHKKENQCVESIKFAKATHRMAYFEFTKGEPVPAIREGILELAKQHGLPENRVEVHGPMQKPRLAGKPMPKRRVRG